MGHFYCVANMVTSPLRGLTALMAGVAAIVAWSLPLRLNIPVAIVLAVLVSLWLEKQAATWVPRSKKGGHHG